MSMCNPLVEEKIPYSADLHEHLVGKGGKTHRYLESNSRWVHDEGSYLGTLFSISPTSYNAMVSIAEYLFHGSLWSNVAATWSGEKFYSLRVYEVARLPLIPQLTFWNIKCDCTAVHVSLNRSPAPQLPLSQNSKNSDLSQFFEFDVACSPF